MRSITLLVIIATLLVASTLAFSRDASVKRVIQSKEVTITTYVDETRNYTKRVVEDILAGPTTYATQSVSVTTSGAFPGTAYLYAARTDNMVTITFKALTGTVSTANTLYINVWGVLSDEFYPRGLGTPENKHGWPVFVSDGGDNVGKMFWYGFKQWYEGFGFNEWAYFKVYGVNAGNFGIGSGRGFDRDISISFRRY